MTDQSPFEGHSWGRLIQESGGGHAGYSIEATRRLIHSVDEQARASDRQSDANNRLSRLMLTLAIAQTVIAVAQIWAAFAIAQVRP